jgi:hypothetical protein
MVRDALLLVRSDLVGADVEPAVDGGGIAVEDLAVEPAASASPSALFPDAVGPSTASTRGRVVIPASATRQATNATSAASSRMRPSCCVRVGMVASAPGRPV